MVRRRSGSGSGSRRQCTPLMFAGTLGCAFVCPLWVFLPPRSRRRSPPPPGCPPLPSTARIHGEPMSVFLTPGLESS
ncbi:hypothetical protein PBY51_020770 [Eleginops maclovinus]|uniref:Transmembrane protein n=1 Tax=Eleginops maclovinus TaxID=56733 RepID=A0AAN8AL06_ELEMC|nr:hypothetical protein PBY51_020770 [Eleginops maclovinus]